MFEQLSKHIASGTPQLSFMRKYMDCESLFWEKDAEGNTLLHIFCREAPLDPNFLCLFRAMECNFLEQNAKGLTPLHLMAQNESISLEALQLVDKKAFGVRSLDGYLPLHYFCESKVYMNVFQYFWTNTRRPGATSDGCTAAHLLMNNPQASFVIDMAYNFDDADNEDGPSRYSLELLRDCIEEDLATPNKAGKCPLDGINRKYVPDATIVEYMCQCVESRYANSHWLQRAMHAKKYVKSRWVSWDNFQKELDALLDRMCRLDCELHVFEDILKLGPSQQVLDYAPFRLFCSGRPAEDIAQKIELLYTYGADRNASDEQECCIRIERGHNNSILIECTKQNK